MSQFPKGSYVKVKSSDYYRKVLSESDGIFHLSNNWIKGNATSENHRGLMGCEQHAATLTLKEMEAYYTPCSASDAGLEEEKWVPEHAGIYWYISDVACVKKSAWYETDGDIFRLKMGNVFKTKEEAQAHLKKVME